MWAHPSVRISDKTRRPARAIETADRVALPPSPTDRAIAAPPVFNLGNIPVSSPASSVAGSAAIGSSAVIQRANDEYPATSGASAGAAARARAPALDHKPALPHASALPGGILDGLDAPDDLLTPSARHPAAGAASNRVTIHLPAEYGAQPVGDHPALRDLRALSAIPRAAPAAAPAAQSPLPTHKKLLNVLDADSTGPNTGAFGSTDALMNAGTGIAAGIKGQFNTASPPVGDNSKPPDNPAAFRAYQGLSAATAAGGGIADAVGAVRSAHELAELPKGTVGPALLTAVGAGQNRHLQEPGVRSNRKAAQGAMRSGALNLVDAGLNKTPSAMSAGYNLTSKAAPAILGPLAAGAGAGVSGAVMLQNMRRGWRADQRLEALGKIPAAPNRDGLNPHGYAQGQMQRRRLRAGIGAAGAGLGLAGGILLAASMATPVGWALAGAGALVAAGLGLHKLYQWHQKRKAKTLGTERQKHALHLQQRAANKDAHAIAILAAIGIKNPDQIKGPDGLKLLEDKLASQ